MKFDFTTAKTLARQSNLIFDEGLARCADDAFTNAEMTQPQANAMQKLWIDIIVWAWNPASYPWQMRLLIALYFLGFFKSKRPHAAGK